MKIKLLIIVGLFSVLVAGVVLMPASTLEATINQRMVNAGAGTFKVSGGTIWSGAGTFVISGPLNSNNRLSPLIIPLRWSFVPSGLLTLRLSFDVITDGRAIKGSARVGAGHRNIKISDADLTSSLELIARFNRNLALLRPSGDISMRSQNETLTVNYAAPNQAYGSLRVAAGNVRLLSIGSDRFGSYEAKLDFDGQTIRYQLDKSSGMLMLKGDGAIELAAPKKFRYSGVATVSRAAPAWLPAALLLVSRPTLDGRFNINYQTGF